MKGNEGIRRMFERRLQEAAETVFYGEVSEVNEGSRTCTVMMEGIPRNICKRIMKNMNAQR